MRIGRSSLMYLILTREVLKLKGEINLYTLQNSTPVKQTVSSVIKIRFKPV